MNSFMTCQELARAAGVSTPTVVGAIKRGEIMAERLGKAWAIHRESGRQYVERVLKSKHGQEGVGARSIFSVAAPVGVAERASLAAIEKGVSRNQYIVDAIIAALNKEA